jgi:hypothetical protein
VQGVAGHPVNKVVDPQKNNWKKWRAEEEEKGSLTPQKILKNDLLFLRRIM